MANPALPIEVLLANLHSEDWTTRCDAARDLGLSGDPRAVAALMADLADSDWKVRRNAAQALGVAKDKRAVDALIVALNDRIMTVRCRAAVALGRIRDVRAIPPLIDAFLTAPQTDLAQSAQSALQKFGGAAFPALKSAVEAHPDQRIRLLGIFGGIKHSESLDLLVGALTDTDLRVRRVAARALSQGKDRRAIPPLRQALASGDAALLEAAIRALGHLRAVESVPDMLALLKDNDLFGPRSHVYRTLTAEIQRLGSVPTSLTEIVHNDPLRLAGALPDDASERVAEYFDSVSGRLDDRLKSVGMEVPDSAMTDLLAQMQALLQTAKSANRDAVTGLIFLLNAPEPLTRVGAALGLPWYQDRRALEPLRKATRDSDPNVRHAAQWALASLEKIVYLQK